MADTQKHNFFKRLMGGFSIFRLRWSFSRLRFWKVRTPGKRADIEV